MIRVVIFQKCLRFQAKDLGQVLLKLEQLQAELIAKAVKPADWTKAKVLVSLLANPDNDLLAYRFVEYIHDLVGMGEPISDEEASRLWEQLKERPVLQTIPRSTLPEPLQTRVRIALRKLSADKLLEAYRRLKAGEATGIELVERNRVYATSAIAEVLWERGKLHGTDIEIEIIDHGAHHKLVKVIRNGRVYAATYAEPFPTKESARADYLSNPKGFLPYDESTGTYLTRVMPVGKSERHATGKLELLADSPEYLTQTIEDIGYRQKIDNAFQEAIARARSGR